jgi:hypothetical protein
MKITKKEIERLDELYEQGISRAMDKMDINVLEWLEEDERLEYRKLHLKEDSQCVLCGEEEKDCECIINKKNI